MFEAVKQDPRVECRVKEIKVSDEAGDKRRGPIKQGLVHVMLCNLVFT